MASFPVKNWYQTSFRNMALDYWHAKSRDPVLVQNDIERLIRYLNRERGHLLDIPCGFGFHAMELATRGFHVTGIDAAPSCIETAQQSGGSGCDFLLGTMESFELEKETYDGAYCLGNSIGYVPPKGTMAFFNAVSNALKPGSRFILSTGMVSEAILPNLTDQAWEKAGDIYFLQDHELNDEGSLLTTECVFLDVLHGKEEKNTLYHYITPLNILTQWLEDAGFNVLHTLSHENDTEFEEGDASVYIVCEKYL